MERRKNRKDSYRVNKKKDANNGNGSGAKDYGSLNGIPNDLLRSPKQAAATARARKRTLLRY
jgi:hypothetical protein